LKLFYIEGIRHHAVVLATDGLEAIKLAEKAYVEVENEVDSKVLFGSVGDWESPVAHELKLPEGFEITSTKSRSSKL
jgi:hypothetical protein